MFLDYTGKKLMGGDYSVHLKIYSCSLRHTHILELTIIAPLEKGIMDHTVMETYYRWPHCSSCYKSIKSLFHSTPLYLK